MNYDLVVIGSGPSGQKGAIAAAKLGKRVAIIERTRQKIGGVCLHSGTVPSKAMREAILYLTGFDQRATYSERYGRKSQITMDDLRRKLEDVITRERNVIHDQLDRNYIDIHQGEASFIDPHTVFINGDGREYQISGDRFLIASGTRPARPSHIPFDRKHIFDSDEILTIDEIPRSMIVIGGGVIGLEYAIMFAVLGVKVTVVDGRERLLDFCDREIIDHLMYTARGLGISFRLGESVASVEIVREKRVVVELESKKRIVGETAFFSVGREGDTARLDPEAAGLKIGKRGRIEVNSNYETSVPHIFGVGDAIGFPSLASTSMEQGRQAVNHIFRHTECDTGNIPYGLFTIPEIAMVGKTEQQLTSECVPFEIGVARFEELAKSQIKGCGDGLLKLLFEPESGKILGVHCIGDSATEIIHIGQAVMTLGGTIDYFRQNVFNHPSMAESYKVAALDG
ncbi:MAG: Si-specific NAD(P)(+) transhydrogenase, partial [Planctomycetota bacterium]